MKRDLINESKRGLLTMLLKLVADARAAQPARDHKQACDEVSALLKSELGKVTK